MPKIDSQRFGSLLTATHPRGWVAVFLSVDLMALKDDPALTGVLLLNRIEKENAVNRTHDGVRHAKTVDVKL
jgi:hypothetical protein